MAVDVKCMSNSLETAVRTAPVHRSSPGIIVHMWQLYDVCADLLRSFWRPQHIDLKI